MNQHNKVKNFLKRKSRGDGELISSIITLYVLIVFMLVFIDLYGDLKTKDYIDGIVRNYTLQLETNSTFDVVKLESELKNVGLTFDTTSEINVIVERETLASPTKLKLRTLTNPSKSMTDTIQYGDIMTLEIKAKYSPAIMRWTNILSPDGSGTQEYYTYRTTTSKN